MSENEGPGYILALGVWDVDLRHVPIYQSYPRPIAWLRRLLGLKPKVIGYANRVGDVYRAVAGRYP